MATGESLNLAQEAVQRDPRRIAATASGRLLETLDPVDLARLADAVRYAVGVEDEQIVATELQLRPLVARVGYQTQYRAPTSRSRIRPSAESTNG